MTTVLRQFPNLLTAIRVFLAPLTAWFLLDGAYGAALVVFAVAGASDALDGFLARRYGLISRFGEYLDPAADKLLMTICFVTLAMLKIVPVWLAAIVIGRDIAIVLGVGLAWMLSLPVKIAPLMIGKASTVVQVGYIGLVLLLLSLGLSVPSLTQAAAVVAAGVTALSWFAYGQLLLKAIALGRRTA